MESHDPTEFGGSSSNSSDFRGRRSRGSGVVGGGSVGWLKRLSGTPVLGCHHDFKPFFKDVYVSIILTILTIKAVSCYLGLISCHLGCNMFCLIFEQVNFRS